MNTYVEVEKADKLNSKHSIYQIQVGNRIEAIVGITYTMIEVTKVDNLGEYPIIEGYLLSDIQTGKKIMSMYSDDDYEKAWVFLDQVFHVYAEQAEVEEL